MRSSFYILYIGVVLLLASCADSDITTGQGRDGTVDDPVGKPVLFSVGNENSVVTRAAIPYMAQDGRFVCTMYYHAKATDTDESDFDIKDAADGGTMTTAWLKVNNTVGNSVYRQMDYPAEDGITVDNLGFDKAATLFYWQNRLTHAFLALADYNKLTTNVGATTNTESDKGKLKMYPNWDKDFAALPTDPEEEITPEQQAAFANKFLADRYANAYDLTRGEIWEEQDVDDGNGGTVKKNVLIGYTRDVITDQPDPILALTVMKPAGATQEANRVRLYFKHQFSQIQVNIKGADDNSANITANQIDGVQLLGVSTEGYVCNRLNADGTVGAASANDVNLDDFTDEQLASNKWGTSFQMFDMATGGLVDEDEDGIDDRYAIGFLKSYNAIAFGSLWAIRITWHEVGTTETPGIQHVSTFEIPMPELRQLASAKKYIYDLELRRGTLAVIRTEILPWDQKEELVYGTDGTITN